MKTGIVIQARLGSSRLPNKVLLELIDGRSILEIIISRLVRDLPDYEIVLATSNNPADNLIETLGTDLGIAVFRGDEKNVLSRFIETGRLFHFDAIVRICADNPFLLTRPIRKLIDLGEKSVEFDYVGFRLSNDKPTILTHIGLFAEWVKTSALATVPEKTSSPEALEHVTHFIYNNPDMYKILLVKAPSEVFEKTFLRFTVDTEEDFKTARMLYRKLNKGKDHWNLRDLVSLAESDPAILSGMKKEILRNEK